MRVGVPYHLREFLSTGILFDLEMIMMRCVQKLQTATDTALMYCDMLRERISNYILPLGVVETSSASRRHDRSIELNSLEIATISCFLPPIFSHLQRIQQTQGI